MTPDERYEIAQAIDNARSWATKLDEKAKVLVANDRTEDLGVALHRAAAGFRDAAMHLRLADGMEEAGSKYPPSELDALLRAGMEGP